MSRRHALVVWGLSKASEPVAVLQLPKEDEQHSRGSMGQPTPFLPGCDQTRQPCRNI